MQHDLSTKVFLSSPKGQHRGSEDITPSAGMDGYCRQCDAIFLTEDLSDSVSIQFFPIPQVATSELKPSIDSVSTVILTFAFSLAVWAVRFYLCH